MVLWFFWRFYWAE